jgi:hypothetical protein
MAITQANIKVMPCTVTWNNVDLGAIEGDIEVTFEETTYEVKAHSTGATKLDEIRVGKQVGNVSVTLLETSVAQIEAIFAASQASTTPVSGTEVIGFGNDNLFETLSSTAQKLVFHPIAVTSSDKTQDIFFWKAYPVVESISVSGESARKVNVSFKIFPDKTKLAEVEFGGHGDHTQTLTV